MNAPSRRRWCWPREWRHIGHFLMNPVHIHENIQDHDFTPTATAARVAAERVQVGQSRQVLAMPI